MRKGNKKPGKTYNSREVAELLGVRSYSIRRYCSLGFVPGVRHNITGRYIFTEQQLDRLALVVGLFRCGFASRDVKKYLRSPHREQRQMLRTKKQQLRQQSAAIDQSIDFLERQEDLLERGAR